MNKIKLKYVKESLSRIVYFIDQDYYKIDDKVFKINLNTSNLSRYLSKEGTSLINLLSNSINSSKKKLYETQIIKKKDDVIKKNIIKESKYSFFEFWEDDVLNNFEKIKKNIRKIINGKNEKNI